MWPVYAEGLWSTFLPPVQSHQDAEFIENNVIRNNSSRSNNLFGTHTTVKFYPFGTKVTAHAPRQKQAGFGRDKNYALVGYSTNHKGGYELYDTVTERIVVRGDVNCLTFLLNTSAWTTSQPKPDNHNQIDGEVLAIDSGSVSEKPSVKSTTRVVTSPSLSLSLSPIHSQQHSLDVGASQDSVKAGDTLSDGQSWESIDVDNPSSSSTSLSQSSTSTHEHQFDHEQNVDDTMSDTNTQSKDEWSSLDEERSTVNASMAFRGEVFAMNATTQIISDDVAPKNIVQGMAIPARKKALLREFDAHTTKKSFKIVYKPTDKDVIILNMHMLQSDKFDENGNVIRHKARMVVDGRKQPLYGYDIDTYAPNMQKESARILVCHAAQYDLDLEAVDVDEAFLIPTLDSNEHYYCYPPPGFYLLCKERNIPFKQGQVLKLLAAVYGLKNASYYWNTEFTQWLKEEARLTQCVNDPCVFYCNKRMLILGIHTDDCLMTGKTAVLTTFKKQLSDKYPIKSLGFPKLWCGLQMERIGGAITISMQTFTEKLLVKFWGENKINPSYSPSSMEKMMDDDALDTTGYPVRAACGNFIWLIINVRFDIAAAFNQIARKQASPTVKMVKFIKRLFRYLSATKDFRLVYSKVSSDRFGLSCSSDSGFDVVTMGGYVWFLGDSLISWKVVTAKSAITSTCDAELFFIFQASKTGKWLVNYMKELMPQILRKEIIIYNDNAAAIDIVNTGKFSQYTRHMATKCNFVNQLVKEGVFRVEWQGTHELKADLLTKSFHPEIFRKKLLLFKKAISVKLVDK
jgi:hypothetical protein